VSKPSQAQIEANRRNSKHSRGPNSPHGKHRSSQNAMRHGLTGRVIVLPSEDMEAYQKFSRELVDSLHPATPMEMQFAQTVADTQWRLNRARTFEDGMLALGHFEAAGNFTADSPEIHAALTAAKVFRDHSKDFVNLSLYEQRLSRAHKEAYRQLRELQAARKAEREAAARDLSANVSADAAAAVSADAPIPLTRTATASVTQLSPITCETIGFVCSTPETAPETPPNVTLTEIIPLAA
jgi:hypothetical protein